MHAGNDRADLYLSERKGKEFYKHLRHYDRLLRSPEHSLYVHLKAGTVLIFDNWRVLHGRTSFRATSGRTLAGCYFGYDTYTSRLRQLGIIF
mmetsp:Transcript_20847/g.53815  ORF Transcript_20847/g.53815 Transcript_20847/m.53815 type:complete len:92 (-) Transcript_20847:278-553(-)